MLRLNRLDATFGSELDGLLTSSSRGKAPTGPHTTCVGIPACVADSGAPVFLALRQRAPFTMCFRIERWNCRQRRSGSPQLHFRLRRGQSSVVEPPGSGAVDLTGSAPSGTARFGIFRRYEIPSHEDMLKERGHSLGLANALFL